MATLLTTRQVAQFVATGFLEFPAAIPDELNEAAAEELGQIMATWGSPDRPFAPSTGDALTEIYPEPSAVGRVLRHPVVAGAIASLVGSTASFDHDFVHYLPAGSAFGQALHQDAIIDSGLAFDIQVFYFPRAVGTDAGGTGFVPGTHLRRVNETDVGRYQHLLGQRQWAGPAGSVLIFHHGMWHRGMPNPSDTDRLMYKIRLNPTEPQVKLWDTNDLEELQNGPEDHIFARFRMDSVAATLRQRDAWAGEADQRLEYVNRARLWRHLSGDDSFDVDFYNTRTELRAGVGVAMDHERDRQQVLFLYLEHSGLFGRVVAWTFHDGSGTQDSLPGEPPYASGVAALQDGWRLIQASAVPQRLPGAERTTGRLEHEFVFERIIASPG